MSEEIPDSLQAILQDVFIAGIFRGRYDKTIAEVMTTFRHTGTAPVVRTLREAEKHDWQNIKSRLAALSQEALIQQACEHRWNEDCYGQTCKKCGVRSHANY